MHMTYGPILVSVAFVFIVSFIAIMGYYLKELLREKREGETEGKKTASEDQYDTGSRFKNSEETGSRFKNREEYERWKAQKEKENQRKGPNPNIDNNSSYYEILGIKASASKEEIKKAYKDLLNVWNPERFSNEPSLQQKAREKIKEIDDAYEKLILYSAKNSSQAFHSQGRSYSNYNNSEFQDTRTTSDKTANAGNARVKVGFISWFWPPIYDSDSCKRCSRQGLYAAILVSIGSTLSAFWKQDLFILIDATFFSIIAFGIYKMSRVASVVGLCIYFISHVDKFIPRTAIPLVAGLSVGLYQLGLSTLILLFINSIRGTFAYHKLKP